MSKWLQVTLALCAVVTAVSAAYLALRPTDVESFASKAMQRATLEEAGELVTTVDLLQREHYRRHGEYGTIYNLQDAAPHARRVLTFERRDRIHLTRSLDDRAFFVVVTSEDGRVACAAHRTGDIGPRPGQEALRRVSLEGWRLDSDGTMRCRHETGLWRALHPLGFGYINR